MSAIDVTQATGQGNWWTGWVGEQVHVVPIGDTRDHDSGFCPCIPRIEEHTGRDQRHRQLIIHKAYDGREHIETIARTN